MNRDVIYILTNPSFPQYVKIGYADNVETRLKQLNNKHRAVPNRDFPRRGRSLIMVPKELKRLYPNAKPEYIEMALERYEQYDRDEGESEIELFGKVLAAVIIDESIGKRGGKHRNS